MSEMVCHNHYAQQNEHCDWLLPGHMPLIKYKWIESKHSIAFKKKIKEYLELTKNKMAFVTAKSNVRSKIIWHFFKRLLYASNDCVCAKIWRSCMSPSLDPLCLPTLHEWHWELFTIRFLLDGGDSSSICQVAFWINVFQCILKKGII